ncbi:hypothetical protein [Geoglobus acetivorans]|uniref:Phage protein n=1 Tax=Geoglobus acetivorans TaxID=565033 RepID=A0A0A7GCY1_GEOAI|nr:hypothetical protein GACE_0835 [Geoglobus acetivorans]
MPEVFDRYVELQVGSTVMTLDEFDIEFSIENDTEATAGQAEITVYNLGKSKQAFKKDEVVQLKAGYRNDYGMVFYGMIRKVWDEKDGADVKTVVEASDMTRQLWSLRPICKKYPKGTSIKTIVEELFGEAGIPIGKIEDPGVTLKKDMVFGGKTTSTPYTVLTEEVLPFVNGELAKGTVLDGGFATLMRSAEYTCYVKNGMGYFVRKGFQDVTVIVLDSESGLMEVQDVSDEDNDTAYKVRGLLNWKINQDAVVKVDSMLVSGLFKVRKYKHVCKGEQYFTEAEVVPV